MLYHVQFILDRLEPCPPLAAMRQVEADSAMDAATIALLTMPTPVENDGEQFWVRVVIKIEDGRPKGGR
jgi:hypothetical protein